jgi:hypothetical protein
VHAYGVNVAMFWVHWAWLTCGPSELQCVMQAWLQGGGSSIESHVAAVCALGGSMPMYMLPGMLCSYACTGASAWLVLLYLSGLVSWPLYFIMPCAAQLLPECGWLEV